MKQADQLLIVTIDHCVNNDAPVSVSENAALQTDGRAVQGLVKGSTRLPPE